MRKGRELTFVPTPTARPDSIGLSRPDTAPSKIGCPTSSSSGCLSEERAKPPATSPSTDAVFQLSSFPSASLLEVSLVEKSESSRFVLAA